MKVRIRGFTLLELLVSLMIIGILGGLVVGALGYFWHRTGGEVLDESEAAKRWAKGLGYTFVAASCANAYESGFVGCTVRVAELAEPQALECNVLTSQCRPMRLGQRP